MEKFIVKYIDFNKCYSYTILTGLLWVVSVILYPVKAIPQKPFQTVMDIAGLCFTLYVSLGFVKFSFIEKKDAFRKMIFVSMALSIFQSSISIISTLVNNEEIGRFGVVPFAMECMLLFFAFTSAQNREIIVFKKLARLYLYVSFLIIPASVILLLGRATIETMPLVLLGPLIIAALVGVVLITYIWYLKMRLFKQLSMQTDWTPL